MTDKLNRVWVRDHPYEPDWTADPDLVTKAHVEHVRRSDYDALAAKLAEVVAERDVYYKLAVEHAKDNLKACDRAEAAEAGLELQIAQFWDIKSDLTAARAALVTARQDALDEAANVAVDYGKVQFSANIERHPQYASDAADDALEIAKNIRALATQPLPNAPADPLADERVAALKETRIFITDALTKRAISDSWAWAFEDQLKTIDAAIEAQI